MMILDPDLQSLATKPCRSDHEIPLALELERRLTSCMLRPVRVHICENVLQLFGTAVSWHEKQQAQEIARALAPSFRLRNELRVCTSRE